MASTNAAPAALAGRIVAAGEASRQAMAELLGLDSMRKPNGVAAVAWLDHAMEVAVEVGGPKPVVLRIEGKTPESKGLVSTDRLNFYFRGSKVPEKLSRRVAQVVPEKLADWSLERLAELLASDPEIGAPAQPMPPSADEEDRPRSLLDTWGTGDSYADFFAGGELARGQLDSIDPSRLFRFVQHCDNECLQVNPHTVAPIVSLVNYPWDDRERPKEQDRAAGFGDISDSDVGVEGMVTTDLTEDDVILGNHDKLRQVLEYAVSQPNPDNKAIFFSNTCVPAVIGEDVQSVVRQVEKESGQRIFYLTVSARSMTTVFQELLTDRRLEAESRAGPPDPEAINLIGFPNTRAVRETQEVLERANVRINAKFLPDLVPEVIDELPRASLSVLYPNSTWQHHYDQLTFDSRTPHIMPLAPYGFEGTCRWVRDVAVELKIDPEQVESALEQARAPYQQRWDELRAEAAEYRLGFVVRDQETYYLTTPSRTWGMPLVTVLEEMGFGIDILVHVTEKRTAHEKAAELRALFQVPTRHTLRAFDSFPFMRQRLEDSPAAAFMSYQFFDWRLTEAGKSSFSMMQFEMGIPGAIRSLERLLRICRSSFYRRYGKYLRRTAEGLRIEPSAAVPETDTAPRDAAGEVRPPDAPRVPAAVSGDEA